MNSMAMDFFATPRVAGNYVTEYNMLDASDAGAMNKMLNNASKEGWELKGRVRTYHTVAGSGHTDVRFWCTMYRTSKLVKKPQLHGDSSADDILNAIRAHRNAEVDQVLDLPADLAMNVIEEMVEEETTRETALDRYMKKHK